MKMDFFVWVFILAPAAWIIYLILKSIHILFFREPEIEDYTGIHKGSYSPRTGKETPFDEDEELPVPRTRPIPVDEEDILA